MGSNNMFQNTPRLTLPLIQQGQAQKHVTHNEALAVLDALVQPVARDADRTGPPESPAEGDVHIVAAGAVDDWFGREGAIAVFFNNGWTFQAPASGWSMHVEALGRTMTFDGTTWASGGAGVIETLGVNATADLTNRLSVSAASTLLNNEGSDHRLVVNKATEGDTASLLFQTGFGGRAEMGTTGDDRFAIKVSADGGTWSEALVFDAATGAPSFPALPHFKATSTGGWSEIAGTDTDLPFDVVDTDPGADFDVATGSYTVPVSGVYAFMINGFLADTTDGRICLAINGVTQTQQMQSLRGDVPLSFTVLQSVQAGDVITFRTGDVNTLLRYSREQTFFSGWKVA